MYSELLKMADEAPRGKAAPGKNVEAGTYRVQVREAWHGYSGTGFSMYTVKLVVTEGPYKDYSINWHLTATIGYRRRLASFFKNLRLLGITRECYVMTLSNQDLAHRIVENGVYLDVEVKQGRNNFMDIGYARRAL